VTDGSQRFLHDLKISVAAPTVFLGDRDGQLRPRDPQGAWHADVRVLRRAEVRVGGAAPIPVGHGSPDAGTTTLEVKVP